MTDMLNLKDKCLHPETGRPYIRSLTGGKDNSPEGRQVSCSPLKQIFILYNPYVHCSVVLSRGSNLGRHHARLRRRVRERGGQGLLRRQGPGAPGLCPEQRPALDQGRGDGFQRRSVLRGDCSGRGMEYGR